MAMPEPWPPAPSSASRCSTAPAWPAWRATPRTAPRGVGFDVVFFGNAGRFDHVRSVVLDRTGDPARARAVAAALGIDSIATPLDSTLFLDATVVLGADWPPPPPHASTPLDRLRRLIVPPDTGS
jgi:hypothetical protein